MKHQLWEMLMTNAVADKAKAELSLHLLSENPAGIGDHSTTDFYSNAEDSLSMLVDAVDRIKMLNKIKSGQDVILG
jgi:hypothetical protein